MNDSGVPIESDTAFMRAFDEAEAWAAEQPAQRAQLEPLYAGALEELTKIKRDATKAPVYGNALEIVSNIFGKDVVDVVRDLYEWNGDLFAPANTVEDARARDRMAERFANT
jgi:hypothetical protein